MSGCSGLQELPACVALLMTGIKELDLRGCMGLRH
jgi:hypothetical protein